ncbi:hypothetical protein ABK040_005783 [Willaertia magna]
MLMRRGSIKYLDTCKRVKVDNDSITIYSNQNKVEDIYHIEKRLGKGGGGSVFLCKRKSDGKPIAIKCIYVEDLENLELATKEYTIVKSLNPEQKETRIAPVYEIFVSISHEQDVYALYFSMPVYLMDLAKFMRSNHNTNKLCFDQNFTLSVCSQMSKSLSFLHKCNICHRDLKPENIFIEEIKSSNEISIVIGDFGLSKEIAKSTRHSKVGTLLYMAPELFDDTRYGLKVDIFSLGVILYQIMSGNYSRKVAWDLQGQDEKKVLYEIKKDILASNHKFDDDFIDIVLSMLYKDPHKRLSATQIHQFSKMKNHKLNRKPLPSLPEEKKPIIIENMPRISKDVDNSPRTPTTNSPRKKDDNITIYVNEKSFKNSLKNLFAKGDITFFSLEDALQYCKQQSENITVTIKMDRGKHKNKNQNITIDRKNIILEGINQKDEETIIQAKSINIVNSNISIRNIHFMGKKLVSGSAVTNPITLDLVDSNASIVNCKIKGRVIVRGEETNNSSPILEGNEIYNNFITNEKYTNPIVADCCEALLIFRAIPRIINNRFFENDSAAVRLNQGGGLLQTNNFMNNLLNVVTMPTKEDFNKDRIKVESAVRITNKSDVVLKGNKFFDNVTCICIEESKCLMDGNELKRSKRGIAIFDSSITMESNEIVEMEHAALTISNSEHNIISNNFSKNKIGLVIYDLLKGKIINNKISLTSTTKFAAITLVISDNPNLTQPMEYEFSDNIIYQNHGGGVLLTASKRDLDKKKNNICKTSRYPVFSIDNNQFFRNSNFGLRLQETVPLMIRNNVFDSNFSSGIIIQSDNLIFMENTLSNHHLDASISIVDIYSCSFIRNQFNDNIVDFILRAKHCKETEPTIFIDSNTLSTSLDKAIRVENSSCLKAFSLAKNQIKKY